MSPGTAEVGHSNITGYALAGRFGAGTSPSLARVQVNETGLLQGVRSITNSGVAVYGQATAASGLGAGGYFTTSSVGGRGIVGDALSTTGSTVGGLFYNRSTTGGVAVWGKCIATTGSSTGVYGEVSSADGIAVYGINKSSGTNGTAIYGTGSASGNGFASVVGVNTRPSGAWARGLDVAGGGTTGDVAYFHSNQASPTAVYAVKAYTAGTTGRAIDAHATDATTVSYGVFGDAASATGYGVWSQGNFGASGTKSFVIDNPLDPANSILKQYCAEGAEPLLVYSGSVKLDGNGRATVSLPDYFSAIAKNPRYSLTAVGSGMPNLHVAAKALGNRFQVAGGSANGQVDWTVYATRNDAWVRTNGAPTIVEKAPEEKGHYIQPQFYGQRPSMEYNIQPQERVDRLAKERAGRP